MLERRSRRSNRSIILLVLILAIIAGTGVFAVLQLRIDLVTDALKRKQPLATLFIFSSGEKALFFEVFFYNPGTRKGSLFYVPPNLGSVIASINKEDGIDVLYRRANPAPLRQKIEDLLAAPLQGVIDISIEDTGRLVDLMGGVDVFIPNPVDITQADHRVLLPSGSVTLDGDKAQDFISYQDPLESDSYMIGRRQKFLQALLKGLGENNAFLLQRGPFRMLRSLLRTDLPGRALSSFIAEMGRFDSERMVLQRVLGTTRSVDGRDLLFPHQEGDLLKQSVKLALAANASNEFTPPETLTITVEVLNGTKTPGLATRARDLFQSYDMEVMAPNNADNDQYLNTVVLDRKGNLDDAKKVADIIRCQKVYSKPDAQMDQAVDVTVILGKDFDGRYVK
ncbi:MAG: LCP family protein [Spirochaetia bacterium]|jgi:anionic cell wall polymer biosynthesis LytR-Cps2A-Psr (LCP) family protein